MERQYGKQKIVMVQNDQADGTKYPLYEQTITRAGFKTGQAGQLPSGLHNRGTSTYVLSPFIFGYSRVGWASTVPLLKAAHWRAYV